MKYAIKRVEGGYIKMENGESTREVATLDEATKFASVTDMVVRAVWVGARCQFYDAAWVHKSGDSRWCVIEVTEQAPKPTYTEGREL